MFQFDVQGQVATSTHADLPWLLWLRSIPDVKSHVHFRPFAGFDVPEGKYPSLYRRRYAREGWTLGEHDAFAVSAWLADMDRHGNLDYYFKPPLGLPEFRQARLEGWILEVC